MILNIDRLSLHYAIRLAITCTLVVAIYQLFHLHNGYWAAFSVLGCMFPTSGQSFHRIKQRIKGTFLGMLLGIIVAYSAGYHWLYLDLFIPIFVFLTVYLKAFNYTFYALFNTIISVALVCLIVPGDWQIALTRMEMTLLGCAIALLATYWILPRRSSDTLAQEIQQTHQALKNYYLAIVQNSTDSTSRSAIFEKLQKTKANLQEINHETWWRGGNQQQHSVQLKKLESIYQILLLLELEFPKAIIHPELKSIEMRLKNLLFEITSLFDLGLNSQKIVETIQTLLNEITTLRTIGAQDTSIPIATFSEHIQLTETLESLNALIPQLMTHSAIA